MRMARYKKSRFWGVYDEANRLVCLCVYKKGAEELLRRFGVEVPPKPEKQARTPKEKKEKHDAKAAPALSARRDSAYRGSRRRVAVYKAVA